MSQAPTRPVLDMRVIEHFGAHSSDVTRATVSFAGLLASRFGAEVLRVEREGGDPMRTWPPLGADGSVLHRFLNGSKRIVPDLPGESGAFLLTDDPDLAERWPDRRAVLVRPAPENGSPHSELTLQAESGLLDVFAGADGKPLPLPGHQLAYAAGMAGFNALLSLRLSALAGKPVEGAEVSVLDVALWINWKHYLAATRGTDTPGIGRIEEWTTLACADGYVTFVFQDKDLPKLAEMTGEAFLLEPELRTRAGRAAHRERFNAAVADWARPRKRAEIAEAAQAARIPIGPVLSVRELIEDAQFQHRQFLLDCGAGEIVPRLPMHWNGGPVPMPAGDEAR